MQQKQWQYGMTIVFGLLMLAIPWVLRFYDDIPIRSWDFYVIGALTAASGAAALHRRSYLAARLVPALGLWMFFSPWIVGFVHNIPARNSAWAFGGFVFLMSLWALLERVSVERSRMAGERA
jgi:hypothetical protein